MPQKKKSGRGTSLFLVILILGIGGRILWNQKISLPTQIIVKKGDTLHSIVQTLPRHQQQLIKLQIKYGGQALKPLQPGSYQFSGNITRSALISLLNAGPLTNYQRFTVLEGWSIYDIDDALVKAGLIQPGEFVQEVTSSSKIQERGLKFPFMQTMNLQTLEGILYPDTYNLDIAKPSIDQLITLQLQNFEKKIRIPYLKDGLGTFYQKLDEAEIKNIRPTALELITLASVIEKEERNNTYKPTIAGIFLTRLNIRMRLDADITLCYGLKQGYESCTPNSIVQNLKDTTNPYNTRQRSGLPPTPIANPEARTMEALINFQKSNYLFYLHDAQGVIHYGETESDHNLNKSKYL